MTERNTVGAWFFLTAFLAVAVRREVFKTASRRRVYIDADSCIDQDSQLFVLIRASLEFIVSFVISLWRHGTWHGARARAKPPDRRSAPGIIAPRNLLLAARSTGGRCDSNRWKTGDY
jgi:hypothetical protein